MPPADVKTYERPGRYEKRWLEQPDGLERRECHTYSDTGRISEFWVTGEGYFSIIVRYTHQWEYPDLCPSRFLLIYWQNPWSRPGFAEYDGNEEVRFAPAQLGQTSPHC